MLAKHIGIPENSLFLESADGLGEAIGRGEVFMD